MKRVFCESNFKWKKIPLIGDKNLRKSIKRITFTLEGKHVVSEIYTSGTMILR